MQKGKLLYCALVAAMAATSSTLAQPCEPGWSTEYPRVDVDGIVTTLEIWDSGGGDRLYVGGLFTKAAGIPSSGIAGWDGQAWFGLDGGVDGIVHSMVVWDDGSGPALFVGGAFQTAGGDPAANIARWDGLAWSALGDGLSGTAPVVKALAVYDDGQGPALYAGGYFSSAGGAPAANIAKWDGASWSPLGAGVEASGDTAVEALCVFDDGTGAALYVGGGFRRAGALTTSSRALARWNGADWSTVGSTGLQTSSVVRDLAVHDDGGGAALYASGDLVGRQSAVMRWSGAAWADVGDLESFPGDGIALTSIDLGGGPRLVAAHHKGAFTFAEWDGAAWVEPTDIPGLVTGNQSYAPALIVFDDGDGPDLYAGRYFSPAPVVRLDGDTWARVGEEGVMTGGNWARLAFASDGLYMIDGGITPAGPFSFERWDGASWEDLGDGLASCNRLLAGDIGAGERVYAVGGFAFPNGSSAAVWSGSSWEPLGTATGILRDACIADLGDGPRLYAVGPAGLRVYNGTDWTLIAAVPAEAVAAFDNGDGPAIYIGGQFTSVDGVPAARIARWDGTAWSGVGGGVSGTGAAVRSLAVLRVAGESLLIAGGQFDSAGGVPARAIAAWDGVQWRALGAGLDRQNFAPYVDRLAVVSEGFTSLLFASGAFNSADGAAAANLAAWDGSAWTGMDGPHAVIRDLAAAAQAGRVSLFLTGNFTEVAGVSSDGIAQWTGCFCPADADGDGALDTGDFTAFRAAYLAGDLRADFSGNGSLGTEDFTAFRNAYLAGCP